MSWRGLLIEKRANKSHRSGQSVFTDEHIGEHSVRRRPGGGFGRRQAEGRERIACDLESYDLAASRRHVAKRQRQKLGGDFAGTSLGWYSAHRPCCHEQPDRSGGEDRRDIRDTATSGRYRTDLGG